jgi:multidrug efflux pump
MISHFFIDRPIFASVLSIIIVLAGLVSMANLPIAQYPEITPVQITVSATYPGASAEVVSQNVAAPIELQVNGADNMLYMYSTTSSTGNMSLNVFFEIGTDPDLAQVDVQNRVNLALPQLPQAVAQQGVSIQKKSSTFLMIVAVYSPEDRYDETYVGNYANLYVLDALKRIPGANQASILGVPDYAMRLWVKPDRMAQLGITAGDITQAVNQQNEQYAVGRIGQPPIGRTVEQTFPVTTKGRLTTPEEFDNIILRAGGEGAALVRFKDVGRAELGAKDYSLRTKYNGKKATLIAIYQQPGANALAVSEQVNQTLKELKQNFPDGLDYRISLDTTKFVQASIQEVIKTFYLACLLVVLVVFIFIQSLRATLIPVVAIPVSIIGTFIGMQLFGFSINMLTLFGLVLAIGVVVDDAIVVVENVERNMTEFGLPAREAAKRAMDEVTGPIVATTLVVLAVFIPVAFLGGITGQLYKQFAITIAISVLISTLVALTLSPALVALLLKPAKGQKWIGFRWFDAAFDRLTDGYVKGVRGAMRGSFFSLAIFGVLLFAVWSLFRIVPTSFVPEEDQGYVFGAYFLPDAASLDRTEKVAGRVTKAFADHPAVQDVAEFSGYSLIDSQNKGNAGVAFVSLKDYSERGSRDLEAPALIRQAGMAMAQIKEGIALPLNPPAIPGLGTTGGFEFWIQSRGTGTYAQLEEVTRAFIAAAQKRPVLAGLAATIQGSNRQMRVDVDREKAESLGVPVSDVFEALQTLFGSLYVSQFNKFSRLWQVIIQAEGEYRSRPEDIENVYVRNRNGKMLPLKAVVTTRYQPGPDLVTRFNNFPAAKVTGNPAPGFSSGQALEAMEEVAGEMLPADYAFTWSGQAYEEKKAGSSSMLVFVFGMVMVFLILAAQYEAWSLPFAVILAIPFALFGALSLVWLRGIENDIYFQIGLVTLIALAAKNAILIVEFAVLKRKEGLSAFDAAVEAARLRLRPICMTSFSFVLGCIPLAIASGASAHSRHSIGTGVIGGMLGATIIAVFFVPLFFWLLQRLSDGRGAKPASAATPSDSQEGGG